MNRQSTPNDDEQHPNGPDTSDIAAPTAANAGAAAAAAADSDPFDSTASVAPGDAVPAAQPDSERTAEELLGLRPQLPPRTAFARALRARSDRRLRARRVRRLVRHIEPWSVLKVSLILYFCVWVIMLFVGVTLWNLAENSGLVSNVENFVVELFALESFTINADQIFRIAAVGGLVMVVAGSGATVLAAVLFNLISDVTGGVRLTVVEEETARPRARRGRRRVLVAAPPPGSGDPRTRR